jgi:hypothetical protein
MARPARPNHPASDRGDIREEPVSRAPPHVPADASVDGPTPRSRFVGELAASIPRLRSRPWGGANSPSGLTDWPQGGYRRQGATGAGHLTPPCRSLPRPRNRPTDPARDESLRPGAGRGSSRPRARQRPGGRPCDTRDGPTGRLPGDGDVPWGSVTGASDPFRLQVWQICHRRPRHGSRPVKASISTTTRPAPRRRARPSAPLPPRADVPTNAGSRTPSPNAHSFAARPSSTDQAGPSRGRAHFVRMLCRSPSVRPLFSRRRG